MSPHNASRSAPFTLHRHPLRGYPRLSLIIMALALACLLARPTWSAQALPVVEKVEFQPLAAQAKRIVDALDFLGAPLPAADRAALDKATTVQEIQKALDPRCLLLVTINPEQRVKVAPGPAPRELDE